MLGKVLTSVRRRLSDVIGRQDELRRMADSRPPARDFAAALGSPGCSVIAEFKRASPSKGIINADMDPRDRARAFETAGASALSVLTEPDHFLGSSHDLRLARQETALPILRKDFTLHPAQVWEARVIGADAVLLIVAILEASLLEELIGTASEAGLAALVEVHDESEARRAIEAGADIVGVNNRNLRTFEVDLATSERIAPLLEGVRVRIAESGINGPSDAARLRSAGYDAVLVGEYLSRADDPEAAVQGLREAK
ncbi:MAG: indole-3-glycerol phosphate synthase TrpC [Acidimicrobiia bacterium]|nr:indole-3-glycerol phosphate synthase TrpC [Acidimicrobiia bacterium]MYF26974.1 indole-3-glycerol phosphate synthase TrpC [Acidimicrobiia bacterium]